MDTLTGIEAVNGSGYDDMLTGDSHNNILAGRAGNDVLSGGGGDDQLDGGSGFDTADFSAAGLGVRVDLTLATAQDTRDGMDTLTSIEALIGSAYDDVLTGNGSDNTLTGGDGTDSLSGRDGNDSIDGGAGNDDLDGGSGNDTILGGDGDDTIDPGRVAGTARNTHDIVDGGAGTNTLVITGIYSAIQLAATGVQNLGDGNTIQLSNIQNATVFGDEFTVVGTDGDNVLTGSGSVTLMGGDGNDRLTGGGGTSIIDGGAGDDILVMLSGGSDTVSYASATSGVTVDLSIHTSQDTIGAGRDKIQGFNNITGSELTDTLRGNASGNTIDGGDGSDTLTGGSGNDIFAFTTTLGNNNIDTITDFTPGSDRIRLAQGVFTGLEGGMLSSAAFYIGTSAHDQDDRIIYNSATGALYFDRDGDGAAAQVQFATLSAGLSLRASYFHVT